MYAHILPIPEMADAQFKLKTFPTVCISVLLSFLLQYLPFSLVKSTKKVASTHNIEEKVSYYRNLK